MTKTNDITVAAFPKSGVTYLGYLLTTARLHANKMLLRPNFYNIDWLLIDEGRFGDTTPRGNIWHDGMGDFIKTHQPNNSGSRRDNAIYLLRNPFDTLRSYYFFQKRWGSSVGTPKEFIESPYYGLPVWLRHINTWILSSQNPSQSVYVLQYEDLVRDPAKELQELARGLGFVWSSEAITEAVRYARIENMRKLEAAFYRRNPAYQQFDLEFVRLGKERQVDGFEELREYIEEATAAAYGAVVSRLPSTSREIALA